MKKPYMICHMMMSVEVRSTLLSSMPDYWMKSAFYSVPESMVEKV